MIAAMMSSISARLTMISCSGRYGRETTPVAHALGMNACRSRIRSQASMSMDRWTYSSRQRRAMRTRPIILIESIPIGDWTRRDCDKALALVLTGTSYHAHCSPPHGTVSTRTPCRWRAHPTCAAEPWGVSLIPVIWRGITPRTPQGTRDYFITHTLEITLDEGIDGPLGALTSPLTVTNPPIDVSRVWG